MNRIDVINALIASRRYRTYLEIGCKADAAFKEIKAKKKVGVDPATGGTVRATSDQFFASATDLFDVIFIDGNHHHDQVLKDIKNSLFHLSPGGVIVMHDCLPQTQSFESLSLCGTAWRAFVQTRERPNLESFVCDFDYGVGIIRVMPNSRPIQTGKTVHTLRFRDLVENRKNWMRPINEVGVANLIKTEDVHWSEMINRMS